jgi:hypothetical protein
MSDLDKVIHDAVARKDVPFDTYMAFERAAYRQAAR